MHIQLQAPLGLLLFLPWFPTIKSQLFFLALLQPCFEAVKGSLLTSFSGCVSEGLRFSQYEKVLLPTLNLHLIITFLSSLFKKKNSIQINHVISKPWMLISLSHPGSADSCSFVCRHSWYIMTFGKVKQLSKMNAVMYYLVFQLLYYYNNCTSTTLYRGNFPYIPNLFPFTSYLYPSLAHREGTWAYLSCICVKARYTPYRAQLIAQGYLFIICLLVGAERETFIWLPVWSMNM